MRLEGMKIRLVRISAALGSRQHYPWHYRQPSADSLAVQERWAQGGNVPYLQWNFNFQSSNRTLAVFQRPSPSVQNLSWFFTLLPTNTGFSFSTEKSFARITCRGRLSGKTCTCTQAWNRQTTGTCTWLCENYERFCTHESTQQSIPACWAF